MGSEPTLKIQTPEETKKIFKIAESISKSIKEHLKQEGLPVKNNYETILMSLCLQQEMEQGFDVVTTYVIFKTTMMNMLNHIKDTCDCDACKEHRKNG